MILKQLKTVPDRVKARALTYMYVTCVRAAPPNRLSRDHAAQLRADIQFHRDMVQVILNG